MKKITYLLMFATLFCLTAGAQNITSKTMKATWGEYAPSGNAFDTIKTTAAVYLYTGPIDNPKEAINIVFTATEVSGTTSGTVTLEASMDGTTWYPYYNSKDSIYSFTLTDVATAQIYRWQIAGGDKYYRVKAVGGGSVSVRITGDYSAYARKQ